MSCSDDAAVDLLGEMLSTPSLCGEEDRVAELILAAMERGGIKARRDEAGNVVGSTGQERAGRSIVILGHMDTVPGEIPVVLKDGKLYGRGAVDAKGPLAMGVVAAIRAAAGVNLRIEVIGAVQEEGPSAGARHLIGRHAPDYLVIAEPSGWDSIVLGYKGSQRFTVSISQPPTHTAHPDPTAPERLVDFWTRLNTWCDEVTPDSGKRASFDRLTATLIGMSSSADGLDDRAQMHIGMRLPPGVILATVQEGVRSLLPDAEFQFSEGEIAVRGEKGNPLVASFLRAIRQEGGAPRFKVKTGTSDMNVVGPVWGCPMLAYGPGDSHLDHTPNEHIAVDEYLRGIRVLTHVLEEL